MASDYFGNEIKVGDIVAFFEIGYRQMKSGTVSKVADKMVTIDHEKTGRGRSQTRQFHSQVIVKPK